MADTWRSVALAVNYAATTSMLDIFQGASGTRVYRVRRAYHFNNRATAVSGVMTTMQLTRTTAASGGSTVTPIAHDTNNTALDGNISSGSGRTVTASSVFRQYLWSNDEPAVGAGTLDEWEILVPFAEVWNAGYGDTNVQPVTCRTSQGFQIYHAGSTVVSNADYEIEFTNEAS